MNEYRIKAILEATLLELNRHFVPDESSLRKLGPASPGYWYELGFTDISGLCIGIFVFGSAGIEVHASGSSGEYLMEYMDTPNTRTRPEWPDELVVMLTEQINELFGVLQKKTPNTITRLSC